MSVEITQQTTGLDEPASGRRGEREKKRGLSPNVEKSVRGTRDWPSGPGRIPKVERKPCLEGEGVVLSKLRKMGMEG